MVNEREASGQQAKLVLLHHIGSQIADIQVLKDATKGLRRSTPSSQSAASGSSTWTWAAASA